MMTRQSCPTIELKQLTSSQMFRQPPNNHASLFNPLGVGLGRVSYPTVRMPLMEYLSALFTLLGVGLGAGVSYLTERVRWRREQVRRWDERRMDAVIDYGRAVKRETRISMEIASGLGLVAPTMRATELRDGLKRLDEAEAERNIALEPLLLLCDEPTVRAARKWQEAVFRLGTHLKQETQESSRFRSDFHEAGGRRDDFYAAARVLLNIPSSIKADPESPYGSRWSPPIDQVDEPKTHVPDSVQG